MISNVLTYNLLMLGVDAAVFALLWCKRTAGAWLGVMICAGLIALILAVGLAAGRFGMVRLVAFGLFLHGVIILAGAAAILAEAAGKTAVCSAALALVLVVVAVDAFLIEPTWLEVSHVELTSPKLDRPVRIVVLADLQTDQLGDYERRVLKRVLEEKPDLILLAGDYLDVRRPRWEDLRSRTNAFLKEIDFDAPEGVFAIKGNIDAGHPWARLFDGLPIVVIHDTRSFGVAGLRLTCLSERDSFNPRLAIPAADHTADHTAGPDRFHLVLGHSPDFALGRIEADLLVAGHTHGGQVRLPLVGALTTGCRVPRSWAAGRTDLPGGGILLVSRGTGMERGDAPRLRFLCRPELLVIDLKPGPSSTVSEER
jgi:predicted MPP superfamily phosphohydrolase